MARKRKQHRYWDSDCFLGWLAKEADKQDKCRGVIHKAEDGELYIVTSTLTITEVVKLRSRTPLPPEEEPTLTKFFENDWIVLRDLDPPTAHLARRVVWDNGVNPKDGVHVATGLRAAVPRMDTFDTDLHKKDGTIGNPPLRIGRPDLPEQLKMKWFEDEEAGGG